MTEDQIKAIAEEYTKTRITPDEFSSDEEYVMVLNRWVSDIGDVLQFVMEKYCIVEREKVMEKYNETDMYDYPVGTPIPFEYAEYITQARSVKQTLTDLFGTSMFNQDEE